MSNNVRIKRLAFSAFRGATRPVVFQFRAEQPIVLIFGENGTGKSTIADALDFLCNRDFGSIRLRSGTTPRTHIVAAGGSVGDLAVEMTCGNNTWRANLQKGTPVTTPDTPPPAFILRRADITKIMEATDGDRYKTLKGFISVPQIEASEATLRSLCKTVDAEVNQAIQLKLVADTTLASFWAAEGKPGPDAVKWARQAVARPIQHWKNQLDIDRKIAQAIDHTIETEAQVAAAAGQLSETQSRYDALQEQMIRASRSLSGEDLLHTLEAARTYLHNHPEAYVCPVCRKPEPQTALLTQIDEQLGQMRQLQSLSRQLDDVKGSLQRTQGVYDRALSQQRDAYARLRSHVAMGPEFLAELVSLPDGETQEDATNHLLLHRIIAMRPQLDQRIEQADKIVDQHNALTTHLATIDLLTETMGAKFALSQRLQAMLAVVEAERKAFVQATVDGISSTVSQLYDRIHPNELLGKPSFGIKPKVTSSLTLTGTFGHNTEIPPAAYYSEAHLDTLGLCVYLALAKQSGNALVVLDDILTSVDDPHLDRVIDLLNDEAPNFGHVIITTHSRAWFDRVRLGQGMKAELIELYGWDLQNGMNHSAALLAVDELREAVQAPRLNRQRVASQAGILLEQLLDELALRYGCPLPRKHPAEYTLGELSQCIDKNLRKLLRTEQLDSAGTLDTSHNLYPLIAVATTDGWIRNQVGAHFNLSAAGIADVSVRQFGTNVLALADAMLCSHCQQLARKNKSGSYWECGGGCGKLRLHPLQAPS